MTALTRILLVDDEPRVLAGIERNLDGDYDIVTATSGALGLAAIAERGPFAVVVSDMRMPNMDGAQFLARARAAAPDTVRLLLTGQAEISAAISAVNEGSIFRFLTKPCAPDVLSGAIAAAAEHHRLIDAERRLLEQTLAGAVRMLTEVLALVSPQVLSRAQRIRDLAQHLATALGLTDRWEVELAATLCYVGLLTLPDDTLRRTYDGTRLSPSEQAAFDAHPEVAAKLVAGIPRLERVAEIVRHQRGNLDRVSDPAVRAGASVLRSAIEYDGLLWRGATHDHAVATLRERRLDKTLVDAIASYRPASASELCSLKVRDLRPGMVLEREVATRSGLMIVARGGVVSTALIERLARYVDNGTLVEPLLVRTASS
jgi:response regulator RpfG family c-di-GMP phosphodiesterase